MASAQTPAGDGYGGDGYGDDQSATAASGVRPNYPGLPHSGNGLETEIGPVKARFYGTILFNSAISDTGLIGQEVPIWPSADSGVITFQDGSTGRQGNVHDLVFTMRQSILGFTLNPAKPSDSGWNPSALLEIDFFGARTADTFLPENRVFNQPRLRMGYFQLEHKSIKLVFGQDKMILAPLDPVSLSHVGIPLGATAGDLWAWMPQARLDWIHKTGNTEYLFQFGVLRPQFGDARLNDGSPASGTVLDNTSGLGERSSQPFYQARLAVSPKVFGSTATFGVSGHFGQEKIGVDHNLQSWALAVDMKLPLGRHAILRGEGFAGSNLLPFMGGIDQGSAVLAVTGQPTRFQKIGAGGGWAELIVPMNAGKDTLYFGAGTDDPKNANLLPGSTRQKNSFLWASYFRKITNEVTLAAEWSYWDFKTLTIAATDPGRQLRGPTGTANVFNVSLAYQF